MYPLIVFLMLVAGLSIHTIVNEKQRKDFQTKSEDEFVTRHEILIKKQQELEKTLIDELIPSKFDEDLKINLLELCQMKDNKWMQKLTGLIDKLHMTDFFNKFQPAKYDAKEEIQFLGFRRKIPAPRPVRIQIVRCSEKYAVIAVQSGRSGYILKKGAMDPSVPGEIFNIYAKFTPRGEKPTTDSSSSAQVPERELSPDDLKQFQSTESDEIDNNKHQDVKESHSPTNGEIAHPDKPTTTPEEVDKHEINDTKENGVVQEN